MKCSDVRIFFSQIADKTVTTPIPSVDMDFLANNGYLTVMQQEDYNRGLAEISALNQMTLDLMNQRNAENSERAHLDEDVRKTHSITFLFEAKENKEAEKLEIESHKEAVSKIEADIAKREAQISELIKKKSIFDRMVPYDGKYISLIGPGIMMLNDLNIRNYRVSEREFPDFRDEIQATFAELRSIAEKGSYHFTNLYTTFQETDPSQLWSLSIGLAKLQGDPNQIGQRFLLAFDLLKNFDCTLENKMMTGEIMAASKTAQMPTNSDLTDLLESLKQLDHQIKHEAHVPSQLSIGVAATILYGKRYDGTFPTAQFVEFSKITASYESAAILSVHNVPSDQLTNKFQAYRNLFSSWGFETSEDTELASAFLSTSDLSPEDVRSKLTIIENGLRNYLEYPLVAAAVLTSVPTLEANELLNLMEKAYFLLGSYVKDLERSEMISLAVRMIHGIRNEIVKELDPTAALEKTPVQFTYVPSHIFFFYYAPLIIAHSSYHSTFSGIGGYHPAHVHGVGGFMG
jgi:hypothetical protein